MADKKTTKVAKVNTIADLRKKSVEELQKLLSTARADLLEAQKSLRANELANPHAVTKMRKEIAQILTIMTEANKSETADAASKKGKGEAGASDSLRAPRDEGKPSVVPHKRSTGKEKK